MANLLYRSTATPTTPASTSVKGNPLTNAEIDANLKSLNDDLALKATKVDAALTGNTTADNLVAKLLSGMLVENTRSITANTASTAIDHTTAGDLASIYKVTMSANTSITFTNPPSTTKPFSFTLMTINDAVAGRAMAFGNTVKWAGGILPPRTTAANAIDIWTFFWDGTTLYGSLSIADAK